MKSKGYIDAASIASVASAFSFDKPEEWTLWFFQSSIETTSFLLSNDKLRVAPAPDGSYSAHDLFSTIMSPLYKAGLVYNARISPSNKTQAEQLTKQWLKRNLLKVNNLYNVVLPSSEDYLSWKERTIAHYFVTHVKMHNALFNEEFIPEISLVLNINKQELIRIWNRSQDLKTVLKWGTQQVKSEDATIAEDAYVLSVLFRGRYHDLIANKSNLQILHHPLRRNDLLPKVGKSNFYKASNTEAYLTSFVLANAFSVNKVEHRIMIWSDCLVKIREMVTQKIIDLSPKVTDDIAFEYVLSVLHNYKFANPSKKMIRALDFISSVILSSSYFLLSQWAGIPSEIGLLIGPGVNVGSKVILRKSVGESISHSIYNTKGQISDMLNAFPGRLESNSVLTKRNG